MIFVGDVAVTNAAAVRVALEGQPVVANLEGPIVPTEQWRLDRKVVFNGPEVVRLLGQWNTVAVTLANNHVFDIPDSLDQTLEALRSAGIASTGAGHSLAEAARPAEVSVEGRTWLITAFGWGPIGCPEAGASRAGTNPLRGRHATESVRQLRESNREAVIVAAVHWDYELEQYPQPGHRRLAYDLVEAGADAVIGCHPHLVQGIEWHRGAPIVYSLGNWAFDEGVFFGGNLRFPPRARLRLAVEWRPGAETRLHWYEAASDGTSLTRLASEDARTSPLVRQLTPFAGQSAREYERWFRANRKKRKGLPVYVDPDARWGNAWRDGWIAARQRVVDLLFRLRLKGGPR